MTVQVIVVDDDPLARTALSTILGARPRHRGRGRGVRRGRGGRDGEKTET